MDSNQHIYDVSVDQLEDLAVSMGEKKYRGRQIYEWIYDRGVISYDEMGNIPKHLKEKLYDMYPLNPPVVKEVLKSSDGTQKFLLELNDNLNVESVLIPSNNADRLTACISTQVGCPVGCEFCATGKNGFFRNLSFFEIVAQIHILQKYSDIRISNVVVMGQGEPFLNFDNSIKALRILNSFKAYNLASRKLTISTSGFIEGIKKFSNIHEQFGLAVSLHSADQDIRNMIMPKMSNQPLESLSEALIEYVEKTNRRVTLEYMLLENLTDTENALRKLINFSSQFLSHINLIPYNDVEGINFSASSLKRLSWFEEELKKAGIPASIRTSKGSDIKGACGQLANNS